MAWEPKQVFDGDFYRLVGNLVGDDRNYTLADMGELTSEERGWLWAAANHIGLALDLAEKSKHPRASGAVEAVQALGLSFDDWSKKVNNFFGVNVSENG